MGMVCSKVDIHNQQIFWGFSMCNKFTKPWFKPNPLTVVLQVKILRALWPLKLDLRGVNNNGLSSQVCCCALKKNHQIVYLIIK
jgi:hypothetical protein